MLRQGFSYRFDALNIDEEPSDLNKALMTLFNAEEGIKLLPFLQGFIPILRLIVRTPHIPRFQKSPNVVLIIHSR